MNKNLWFDLFSTFESRFEAFELGSSVCGAGSLEAKVLEARSRNCTCVCSCQIKRER